MLGKLSMIFWCLNRVIDEVRNPSIAGHGYRGVSKDEITSVYINSIKEYGKTFSEFEKRLGIGDCLGKFREEIEILRHVDEALNIIKNFDFYFPCS